MPKAIIVNKAIPAPIFKLSGKQRNFPKKYVKVLKLHHYKVQPEKLSGDAPKDLIYVYEYGRSRKINSKKWIPYIAKVGHKWFPSESITEHLLTRLGQVWGFNLAKSRLYVFSGQLRFCSEFFRMPKQELVHGADILARHLLESNAEIIDQIDKNGWSQELLSFKFVKQAITDVFPEEANDIIFRLINMLLFDAIVGNNDRHFFNWGVLRDLIGKKKTIFSPIYDTARGLFWNYSDEILLTWEKDSKQLSSRIIKYNNDSKPKMGWEGKKEINHFQMVKMLLINKECTFALAKQIFSNDNLKKAEIVLNTEFKGLISDTRKSLIIRSLEYRFEVFNTLLNS